MKSLTAFLQVLLHEMGEWCHTSTTHDHKTIVRRVEHEGLSFLTITLPDYGKSLQKAIDRGQITRSDVTCFKWHRGLPVFLQGFLELVFDRETGLLLDSPNIDAIAALHQVTTLCGKLLMPCAEERVERAIEGYLQCEQELKHFDRIFLDHFQEEFHQVGMLLWAPLLSDIDRKVFDGEVVPKHGPGATADRLRGNSKYQQSEWTTRLEEWFPFGEYALPSWRHFPSADVQFLEPGEERPVRVITVPKTLKSPRIIAIEPTCMQYVQQGILEAMRESIEADDTASWLIRFDDQTPNRRLARLGSLSGELATLDLSEASDRVSNQHVRTLLRRFPSLAGGVDACRSRKADVPGHGVIRLSKFASMGSALCFPFEALVFATIIFIGIQRALNRPLTKKDVKSLQGRVRVYGDDIIVPVEFVDSVVTTLTDYGMKVNVSKSFWTGRFRESCGGDYYAGRDITPVRLRRMFPSDLRHADEIISTVALRNLLFEKGFVHTVAWLDDKLTRVLRVFPVVPRDSRALGRWTHSMDYTIDGFHRELHVPLVKAHVVTSRLPDSRLDGVGALTKHFLRRGFDPFDDEKHLLRAGRPSSVDIKMRWVPAV